MKRTVFAALAATLTIGSAAVAQTTALDWQTQCHNAWANRNASAANVALVGSCMGYTAGVIDGLRIAHKVCSPPNAEFEQARRIIMRYMNTHPEELNLGYHVIIAHAMISVWPCFDRR